MTYTLSDKSYGQIDNGRINLFHAVSQIRHVLNQHLVDRFEIEIENIQNGLDEAHKQEDENEVEFQSHIDQIKELYGPFKTVWSIRGIVDLEAKHPFGPINDVVHHPYSDMEFAYAEIKGKTWVDIWKAAEEAITARGDTDHIFIEDVEVIQLDEVTFVLEIITGS